MRRLEPVYIDVAASIIADISSGIYRTPANALKELISNSFDVDATEVFINTGYSNFDVFTCSDNGKGMTVADFIWFMQHVGGSVKRFDKNITDLGRPVIGKLGIGLLAVSQICKEFTIISSNGNGEKFEATINLQEFEEIEAAKKQLGKEKDVTVRIGEFEPVVYKEEKGKTYTQIILKEIDQGYRISLARDFNLPNLRQRLADSKGFMEFVKSVAVARRGLSQFSEYDRLIWELALVAPIKYLEEGPIIDENCIPQIKSRLNDYNFKVIIDGLELRKPILFPLDKKVIKKGIDYDFVTFDFDDKIGDLPERRSRLKFNGYVYFQKKAVTPPELRGILIRIRNVAIGYYDKSLLHYPLPAGPLANQISGEIYVEKGLESALNIDRNSFRETDLHYLALQEKMFHILSGTRDEQTEIGKKIKIEQPVFNTIRLYSKKRRESEIKSKQSKYLLYLQNILKRTLKANFFIEVIDDVGEMPVRMEDHNKIKIFDKNPLWPKKTTERNAYRKLLIFKEVADQTSESIQSARATFFRLLRKTSK
jgi:hypothetical protein